MSILDLTLAQFFGLVSDVAAVDVAGLEDVARRTIKYLRSSSNERVAVQELQRLEEQWYAALDRGSVDWTVYDGPLYLAEVWACWVVYSRTYLRDVHRVGSKLFGFEPSSFIDLGCGPGLTTARLRELYPNASIVGTNLPGTTQWSVASELGKRFRFSVAPEPREAADVVIAFEYFEHLVSPIEHLRHVLDVADPKVVQTRSTRGPSDISAATRWTVARSLPASCSGCSRKRWSVAASSGVMFASGTTGRWLGRGRRCGRRRSWRT